MQIIRRGLSSIYWRLIVDQIPINIMLHDKTARIKPIVKDLTTHYMSAHSPAILIFLLL